VENKVLAFVVAVGEVPSLQLVVVPFAFVGRILVGYMELVVVEPLA